MGGCKMCGNCCSNFLPLTKSEIKRLKQLAKHEYKQMYNNDWYSVCPFLNNNRCTIYNDRPLICREYTCSKFNNSIYSDNFMENLKREAFVAVDLRKDIFKK